MDNRAPKGDDWLDKMFAETAGPPVKPGGVRKEDQGEVDALHAERRVIVEAMAGRGGSDWRLRQS